MAVDSVGLAQESSCDSIRGASRSRGESGFAILTMVSILMALVGSYHYYNKGVGKTQSQILTQGAKNFSLGDVFAFNVINRVANIIKSGPKALCHDGSPASDSAFEGLHEHTKTFRSQSDSQRRNSLYSLVEWEKGDTPGDVVNCLVSEGEELRGITEFKVEVEAYARGGAGLQYVRISASGKSKLPFDDALQASFEDSVSFVISVGKREDFGVIFDVTGSNPVVVTTNGAEVIFDVPVLMVVDEDKGLNLEKLVESGGEAWGGGISFQRRVVSNSTYVDFASLRFGNFLGAFPDGIFIKSLLEDEAHEDASSYLEDGATLGSGKCEHAAKPGAQVEFTDPNEEDFLCARGKGDTLSVQLDGGEKIDTLNVQCLAVEQIEVRGSGKLSIEFPELANNFFGGRGTEGDNDGFRAYCKNFIVGFADIDNRNELKEKIEAEDGASVGYNKKVIYYVR